MPLLDSQAVLWLVEDDARLGPQARTIIDEAVQVHFSAATVWELTIKSMLGKLTAPANLTARFVAQGLQPLPVTSEHAETLREFPELSRHDPFDRLLVAQARQAGLTLLTADDVLLKLDRNFIVDVRT